MSLAVYARKCSRYDPKHNPNPVTKEELTRDAMSLLKDYDGLTKRPENHFTKADIEAALLAFDQGMEKYPRAAIEARTGIQIPKTKRNGRTLDQHLKICRAIKQIMEKPGGRPSKEIQVLEWRKLHPEGRKIDCIRETHLGKTTVYKYWNTEGDGKK